MARCARRLTKRRSPGCARTPMLPSNDFRITRTSIFKIQKIAYGYRRIAALLRDLGWSVSDGRVEWLWRREGLLKPCEPRIAKGKERKNRLEGASVCRLISFIRQQVIISGKAYDSHPETPRFQRHSCTQYCRLGCWYLRSISFLR